MVMPQNLSKSFKYRLPLFVYPNRKNIYISKSDSKVKLNIIFEIGLSTKKLWDRKVRKDPLFQCKLTLDFFSQGI